MRDDKYIVIKRSDWAEVKELLPSATNVMDPLEQMAIEDAVVIRRQDVFAPPALDAYSSAIQTAIELMAAVLPMDSDATEALADQVKELRGIADYFHSQAQEAWLSSRKIPDL